MGKVVTIDLDPAIVAGFERVAGEQGRTLEAELRALIEANSPHRMKDCAALLRLSDEALAMTPPDGPDGSDSTLLIRWDRDTDGGRHVDDGWARGPGR